jgi:hypothetical protein
MKRYALLYDEVVLQDGRYSFTVIPTGSADQYTPSGVAGVDRSQISYFSPGGRFAIQVSREPGGEFHPLLEGEKIASYEVDFYPILHDAELLGADYFIWLDDDINQSVGAKLKAEAATDRSNPELLALLPSIHFLQASIVNSLYIDATMAHALHLPFGVDEHASRVIDWKRRQIQKSFQGALRDAFFKRWVSLGFPDYSNESWEDVHNLRESGIGKDFRRVIQRISDAVQLALPDLTDDREIEEIITREFFQELVRELFARRASVGKATWNVAANVIPFGSLVSSVNDFREAIKEERSWICLLGDETGIE